MAVLNGKWKLISAEKIGEYCKAIDTQDEFVEKALQLLTPSNNIIQSVSCNETGVTITTQLPGKTTEVKAEYGHPVETSFLDDRVIKTTFNLDGDILKEEQSGAFTSSNVRFVENGQLVYKMTAGGVTTTRRYNRI